MRDNRGSRGKGRGGGFKGRRDRNEGGGFGGGRQEGGFGGGGGFHRGHNRGPREEHEATCAECGKKCTVPFKPSGDRPVYCRDCFQKHKPQRY